MLAFTQGSNVVSGDVISFGDSMPGTDDHGRVVIGPDTNVAFEDDFFTLGTTQISPGSSFEVLKGNSFAVGGTFSITVEGSPTGLGFDAFQITGDASFSGNLQVSFTNGSVIPPFSSVPLVQRWRVDRRQFSTVTPSGLPFGSPIDFFTFVFSNQLYLAAFSVPAAGGGPDLNGDGIVDNLDLCHLEAKLRHVQDPPATPTATASSTHRTTPSGGTIAADPFPALAAAVASVAGFGGTVPEPASIALLVSGGLLALALAAAAFELTASFRVDFDD